MVKVVWRVKVEANIITELLQLRLARVKTSTANRIKRQFLGRNYNSQFNQQSGTQAGIRELTADTNSIGTTRK